MKENPDIWHHFDSPMSKIQKIRVMEKVEQPSFKTPPVAKSFMQGNQECLCVCKTKYLPRNAILIHPVDKTKTDAIYDLMVKAWRLGRFKYLKRGSCQNFITAGELKTEFNYIRKYAKISCVDNIDNSKIEKGDILLSRVGDELVGKPHLITEKK